MGFFDSITGIFKGKPGRPPEPIKAENYPMVALAETKFGSSEGEYHFNTEQVKKFIKDGIAAYVTVPEYTAAVEAIKADIISEGWTLYGKKSRVEMMQEHLANINFAKILDTLTTDLLNTSNAFLEFRYLSQEEIDTIYKVSGRRPKMFGLWNLPPQQMDIVLDRHGVVKEYVQNAAYMGTKAEVHFKPEEVIHISINKPASLPFGIPYVASLDLDLALLQYAKAHARAFFRNSAIPDMVVKYAGKRKLPQEEINRMKSALSQLRTPDNKSRSIIVQGEWEFDMLNSFNKDLEFINLIEKTRENIWSVFGVPRARILGGANARSADLDAYYARIGHIQRIIESALNKHIFSKYGLEFRLSRSYKVDELRETQKYVLLVQNGILTADEARRAFGYEPIGAQARIPKEQLPQRDMAASRPRGGDGISDSPEDRGANLDNIPQKSAKMEKGIFDNLELDPAVAAALAGMNPQAVQTQADMQPEETVAADYDYNGPYFIVDFDTFRLIVERQIEFWKANILYYEDDEKYVLYWNDGNNGYKTIIEKESIDDEATWRFEYLRNAVRVYNEV